jgi:DnaJ-domain-containing protein 1
MGQLFNRVKNFAKSYINDLDYSNSYAEKVLSQDDDELKRIIDELNSKKENKETNKSQKSYQSKESQKQSNYSKANDSYYTMGLNPNATNEEIKLKYKQLVKELHPDKLKNKSENEIKEAEKKLALVNSAYNQIKKERKF